MSEILKNTYTKTVKLRYEIDTSLNECYLSKDTEASPLISRCKLKIEEFELNLSEMRRFLEQET